MLSVTPQAACMIKQLTDRAGLPRGAGLRIARHPGRPGLAMSLALRPAAGDRVVVTDEAVIYLDPPAAQRLRRQTLDGRSDDRGSAFFL